MKRKDCFLFTKMYFYMLCLAIPIKGNLLLLFTGIGGMDSADICKKGKDETFQI